MTLNLRLPKATGVLLSAVLGMGAIAATAVRENDRAEFPLGTPIPSPLEEKEAVHLPGRSINPAVESWESLNAVSPSSGTDMVPAPPLRERWVRNVATPTLSIFRPDPSRSSHAAMIVAPGGGFMQLAMDREGYSPARLLTERGITVFVLKYRLTPMPSGQRAFFDAMMKVGSQASSVAQRKPNGVTFAEMLPEAQRAAMRVAEDDGVEAMRYVRAHALQWDVSPHRIGFLGFSAGASVAVGVAQRAEAGERPDVVVSIYGLLPDKTPVPPDAPRAFIAVATDDALAVGSTLAIFDAWRASHVPAELHVFQDGGHGFGVLRQGASSDQWPGLLDHWLLAQDFERAANAPVRHTSIAKTP